VCGYENDPSRWPHETFTKPAGRVRVTTGIEYVCPKCRTRMSAGKVNSGQVKMPEIMK